MVILCIVNSIIISILGVITGLYIFLRPQRMIQIQQKFYFKINWRMEPVSMLKEIRNTKSLGLFLVAAAILALLYIFISNI